MGAYNLLGKANEREWERERKVKERRVGGREVRREEGLKEGEGGSTQVLAGMSDKKRK